MQESRSSLSRPQQASPAPSDPRATRLSIRKACWLFSLWSRSDIQQRFPAQSRAKTWQVSMETSFAQMFPVFEDLSIFLRNKSGQYSTHCHDLKTNYRIKRTLQHYHRNVITILNTLSPYYIKTHNMIQAYWKEKSWENKYNSSSIILFTSMTNTKCSPLCMSNKHGVCTFLSRPMNRTRKVVSNHLSALRPCFITGVFSRKATDASSGCNPTKCDALTRSESLWHVLWFFHLLFFI